MPFNVLHSIDHSFDTQTEIYNKQDFSTLSVRRIKYSNEHRCMKYHLASYTKFEQPDTTHYYRMIMCVVTKE